MTWFLCLGGFPLHETPPSGAVKDKTGSNVFFLNHFPMVGDGHQPYCRD